MIFTLLALAPMLTTVLCVALLVPFLIAAHTRHAEGPIEAAPSAGWALALDAAMADVEVCEAIDAAWPSPMPMVRPRAPRPAPSYRVWHRPARPRIAARRPHRRKYANSEAIWVGD